MFDTFDFDFDINKTIKEQEILALINNSFNGMDDNSENEEKSNFLFAQYFKDEGEKYYNYDHINSSTVIDSSNKNIDLLLSSEKNNKKNLTPNNKKLFATHKEEKKISRDINNRYDNMKKKIARHFFNTYLVKKRGGYLKLKKFPRNFFGKLNEKAIKSIWNSTLEDILKDNELYLPNSDVIDELKLEEDKNIMDKSGILNMEVKNLFEEYLESKCYDKKTKSIKEQFGEDYGKKYDYCSKNFVKKKCV